MKYIIATSRGPVSHDRIGSKAILRINVGGVSRALSTVMSERGGTWICWGDGHLDAKYEEENYSGYKIHRIFLDKSEKVGFYDDYSNSTLWPLFHYFREKIEFLPQGYERYKDVNRKFANAIVKEAKPGDRIWIHDYQLSLVPKMIKDLGVKNFVIFSWHIPWVASEYYSILPESTYMLESINSADLITFHTATYVRNFENACERILGVASTNRKKVLGVPLGVDYRYYAYEPVKRNIWEEKKTKLIFSIDRLDYTKGLAKKIKAIDELLRRHPDTRKRFTYVMIVTPSRYSVSEYQNMRREIEMLVGRINGIYSDLDWYPIIYMYRRIPQELLLEYYRAADVAFITPLIDGLNLVCKEFISATRKGIVVLSEFAGASIDMPGSLIVNPYDVSATADSLYKALMMTDKEKLERLGKTKKHVKAKDIRWWVSRILGEVDKLEYRTKNKQEEKADPRIDV